MVSQSIFIIKLLIVSALLSVAIKGFAPYLSISPTATNALIAVLLPSVVIAIAFLFRYANLKSVKS